ncbi:MAG: YHS domain-containing protein, partial [Alphaproteobacteria bacterium]|nr:YHS domain-containing protein [Alphaproteobacteria bacterium]
MTDACRHRGHDHSSHSSPAAATEIDPVCGMMVKTAGAKNTAVHDGQTYFFCSPRCRGKFTAERERYLEARPAPAEMPAGTIYTCPMHPQIRRIGPGSCPICGMALEPADATAATGPNPELVDMTRRLWLGLGFAAPLVAFDMALHLELGGLHHFLPAGAVGWLELALASPAVLWAGRPFFARGWASVLSGHLNMFTLIALGT